MWKFNNNRDVTETFKKICGVFGQGAITDRQVQNWFSKFYSGDISLRV